MAKRFNVSRLVWMSLIVSVLILASCSSGPEAPAASQGPSGRLIVAASFTLGTLDPPVTNTLQHKAVAVTIFDSLVELQPNGQVRPGIAERWEIAPDGKTHTFYIRKGVKFHNGDDLTGADVKFSIERMLAPDATHTSAPELRNSIASVELKDAYTVVLNLKQPAFELLPSFASLSGTAAVVPKKYIEEKGVDYFRRNPIGSGPWKVVSNDPGTRLDLEANENHWRAVPKFKNLTMLNVVEESTKVAMLKTGELDIADVAPDSVAGLKSAGLRVLNHNGGAQYVAMTFYDPAQPEKYILGNPKVRKALSLAVNRQEMADKVYSGAAEPGALAYAPKSAYFMDDNLRKPDPYDPEGAKKLLAEAGFPNGVKIKLWEPGAGGILSTLNLALAGYWLKAGINAELVPVEFMTVVAMFQPKPTPQIYDTVLGWRNSGGVLQFEQMLVGYHSKLGFFQNTNNPRLDELLVKVPLTMDPAEKKKMATEAAVLAKQEHSVIAILDVLTPFALGPKVGEITPIQAVAALAPSLELATPK